MIKDLFNYLKGNIRFMLGVWIFVAIISIPFFIGIDTFSIENKDEVISYSWYYIIALYAIMYLRFRHIIVILKSTVKALHYFLVWLSMGVLQWQYSGRYELI